MLSRDGEDIDDVIRLSASGVDLGDAAGVSDGDYEESENIRAVAIDSTDTARVVRIYIDEIDKDETVVLTYGPVTVAQGTSTSTGTAQQQ